MRPTLSEFLHESSITGLDHASAYCMFKSDELRRSHYTTAMILDLVRAEIDAEREKRVEQEAMVAQ